MLKRIKKRLLRVENLSPIKDWHTNNCLKGFEKDGVVIVKDLPITQLGDKVVSIWKANSLLTRLKFLFTGKVNFQILAPTHQPISISIGEYDQAENNDNENE